jgi:hypothetical protein
MDVMVPHTLPSSFAFNFRVKVGLGLPVCWADPVQVPCISKEGSPTPDWFALLHPETARKMRAVDNKKERLKKAFVFISDPPHSQWISILCKKTLGIQFMINQNIIIY